MNIRRPASPRGWPLRCWLAAFGMALVLPLWPWTTAAEYGNVVLNERSEQAWVPPVIFPHWFHRIRFRCAVCHGELGFEMRVGGNPMNMDVLSEGKYCGACHDGQLAWGLEECALCHSGRPGLPTGIRGGHQTGGPGRW